MSQNDSMAARLLATSASAYAAYASNRLLEAHPEVKTQFGESAFQNWREHFEQRIVELAAAVKENEPKLFSTQLAWSKTAFEARDVADKMLVDSLDCLQSTLEEELPEFCRGAVAPYFEAARNSFQKSTERSELDFADPIEKLAGTYMVLALEGNTRDAIQAIVSARNSGLSLQDTYRALQIAQREVGMMWHRAEINVAEEHLVTFTTQRVMSILVFHEEKASPNGRTVLSAAVAGNTHDMGVRCLSDFFEVDGWRAICLGSDAPPIDIAQAVECFDVSLLLLSAAISTQINSVRTTIQSVRQLDTECKIMVGGNAFLDTPEIWKQLGADGYALTPEQALSLGNQWFSG